MTNTPSPPTMDLLEAVVRCQDLLNSIDAPNAVADDRFRAFAHLRHLRSRVETLMALIESDLAATMEEDRYSLQGVGTFQRAVVTRSAWAFGKSSAERFTRDLVDTVADVVATDRISGEKDLTHRNVAREAALLLLEAVGQQDSLTGAGRKKLGLDMGDYREFRKATRVTIL